MKPRFTGRRYLPLLLCAAVAGLSSCKLMRKNYDVMSDRVSPVQSDEVMVEAGGALPAIAPASALAPAGAAPAAAGSGRVVTVRQGDTLSALARKHGTTVAAICAANGITPTTPIRIGQQLHLGAPAVAQRSAAAPQRIPAPAPAAATGRSYTVRRGDTLSHIAARHGVSTAALLRANGMTPQQANHIREGQKLRIPAR